MIIGRGDIASTIADVPNLDRPDRIYFASGVRRREKANTNEKYNYLRNKTRQSI